MSENDKAKFTEIQIPVPWGTIVGRWYGDQNTQPILALHGWLDNCGTYARLAPLLVPRVSLLCIDLPGHGYSSHLPAGILYEDLEFVRTITLILKAYNWQKVSLLGHSMGARAAFHFAAFYPKQVDLLICIDMISNNVVPKVWSKVQRYTLEKALIDNSRLVVANETCTTLTTAEEPPSYSYSECELRLYEGTQQSIDIENCKYLLERNLSKSKKYPNKYYFSRDGRLKYIKRFNPEEELLKELTRRICHEAIPFLEINGGSSKIKSLISAKVYNDLQANNPHFHFHVLPNGKHHLHMNQPQPVADMIIEFLQKYHPVNTMINQKEHKVKARL